MAWTSPKTWVANAVLTAAELNAHLRDNLNETAAAKATTAGQIFVATGLNSIAARTPTQASILTSETTASATFAALFTPGPAVTVTTGTSALVLIRCGLAQNTSGAYALAGYAISGATTVAASDDRAVQLRAAAVNQQIVAGVAVLQTGLTPGSNTFTMQYSAGGGGGTATLFNRGIAVIPL